MVSRRVLCSVQWDDFSLTPVCNVFQDVSEKDVRVNVSSRRKRAVEGDSVDSESLLSTSSNLEPFASDDLGKHTAALSN